jgi:hypothetical protein
MASGSTGQWESLPKVAVACGDRSHGNWRMLGVMIEGEVVSDVPLQARVADDFGTSVKTVVCPRRPLTPSTAPWRAQAARGGSVAQSTGRLGESSFNQGGSCAAPAPLHSLRGGEAAGRRQHGHERPRETATAPYQQHQIFPVAPGAGYEGALSFILCYATSP